MTRPPSRMDNASKLYDSVVSSANGETVVIYDMNKKYTGFLITYEWPLHDIYFIYILI